MSISHLLCTTTVWWCHDFIIIQPVVLLVLEINKRGFVNYKSSLLSYSMVILNSASSFWSQFFIQSKTSSSTSVPVLLFSEAHDGAVIYISAEGKMPPNELCWGFFSNLEVSTDISISIVNTYYSTDLENWGKHKTQQNICYSPQLDLEFK